MLQVTKSGQVKAPLPPTVKITSPGLYKRSYQMYQYSDGDNEEQGQGEYGPGIPYTVDH